MDGLKSKAFDRALKTIRIDTEWLLAILKNEALVPLDVESINSVYLHSDCVVLTVTKAKQ